MTAGANVGLHAVDDRRLARAVEAILGERAGDPCRIVQFRRSPSAFSSSYVIEELEITLETGRRLALLFKNLSTRALTTEARAIKPRFLFNARREIEVYEHLLPRYALGTANYVGSVIDEREQRFWLFLDKVPGVELYQVGDFEIWLDAARWLARFHNAASALPRQADSYPSLLRHDRSFYRAWPRRAKSNLDSRQVAGREELDGLFSRYEEVIDRMLALPHTLLHGDFNASNILVREEWETPGNCEPDPLARICPVDWEMAAVGPGLTDLAALISGSWNEAQRMALIMAYLDEWRGRRDTINGRLDILNDVRCCQLHLAVQWLGWSPDWSPPPEHRQDWLGLALDFARQLGY